MKIKMLRNTICGGENVSIGQIVDASERDAIFLVSINKAVFVDKKSQKTEGPMSTSSASSVVTVVNGKK